MHTLQWRGRSFVRFFWGCDTSTRESAYIENKILCDDGLKKMECLDESKYKMGTRNSCICTLQSSTILLYRDFEHIVSMTDNVGRKDNVCVLYPQRIKPKAIIIIQRLIHHTGDLIL